ncbi:hypothetical protein CLAFUR4_03779 [Fulvia fulva]|nr:hypothetical protein CLAFUR4_03779 [Fulvia fulva]WPV25665.1 hypothetical protein CLAFUW7_03783 [Fulvia fulva]
MLPAQIYLLALASIAKCSMAQGVPTFGSIAESVGKYAGPLGDVLGVIDFIADKIPDASDVGGTVVQIGTSGERHDGEDFVVWTFDSMNKVLGSSSVDPGMIKAAGYRDIQVHQHMGDQAQGQYVDIIAGDDEICISYILATYPSGPSGPRAWLGDVGAMCGQAWEHSSTTYSAAANETHYGKCVWMDTDHGDDIDYQPQAITNRQMKINMNAYGGDALKEENRNLEYICGATIFTWDIAIPIDVPTPKGPVPLSSLDSRDAGLRKRYDYDYKQPGTPRQRSQNSAERLVVKFTTAAVGGYALQFSYVQGLGFRFDR